MLARAFLVGSKWYSVCVWLQSILVIILLGLGVFFWGLCEVISDFLQMCLSTLFLSLGVCVEESGVYCLCGSLGVVCWVLSIVCVLYV